MARARILVVEDERIVAEDVGESLDRLGYCVLAIVSSGEEAVKKAEELGPDLVLMDIVLRGDVDGIEAAEQIRAHFKIPVVYLTAYANDETLERAKVTQPFGYIVKPFEERELYTSIEVALYKHKMEAELRSSRQQLRNLAAHLQSVREEERASIARELHDEMGQALTALKMDLSWLNKRLAQDDTSLAEKVESMSRLTDRTIQGVRRLSTELRPGILDDLGLAAAIEWQVEEFEERTGIGCEVSVDDGVINLEQGCSTAIFRIFQEALTNVARHAGATKVKASLKDKDSKLVLEVKDNGRGITEKQISDAKSFGIMGMRERVYPWGGEVKISGMRGEGTTVRVSIPLGGRES